jgi:hypothetical protein
MATDEFFKSVLPGAQLGPYSIETRLGAGGPAFAREASFGESTEAMERTCQ